MTKAVKPNIARLLEFQKLLLAFSQIDRRAHRKHGNTYIEENDTEHSYNLAMTAWYLVEFFPHLNRDLVIRFALVHDLVEIHAGDTYIYGDQADLDSKYERERKAHIQLQKEWPDFSELTDEITLYESRKSEEAKFVYALDKIMPIMLIYIHKGYTWQLEKITPERLDAAKRSKVAESPEINIFYEQLYALLLENKHLFGKA